MIQETYKGTQHKRQTSTAVFRFCCLVFH